MSHWTLAPLCCLCISLHAAEPPLSPAEEDKIAAQEDAAGDTDMVKGLQNIFTGMLALDNADKPSDRGVIGSLSCADGKNYPIKAFSDEVLTQLKLQDQKRITVAGKLRVNGKYLVVLALVTSTPSPTPRDKRKRNGL